MPGRVGNILLHKVFGLVVILYGFGSVAITAVCVGKGIISLMEAGIFCHNLMQIGYCIAPFSQIEIYKRSGVNGMEVVGTKPQHFREIIYGFFILHHLI